MRGEEQLHSRVCNGLDCHQVFGFFSFCVGVNIHVAHVEAEQDEDGRGKNPFAGTGCPFLDFFVGESVSLKVACKLDSHRIREFLFDG